MTLSTRSSRFLLAGLASLVLVQPAFAAGDPRRVQCAQTCTLTARTLNGSIDIKNPLASGTLKTLAQAGDAYELAGGQEYVLVLNESKAGWFSFELQFTPKGEGAPWSCRVRTIPDPPYIAVDRATWTGTPGQVTLNLDRTKPIILLSSKP